ncbi:MAG: hypothetical protein QNJ73_12350 [Gammaproteobacteria bacterium]|nr:hypothetical protein [Gammaproteobacteria bacterium]
MGQDQENDDVFVRVARKDNFYQTSAYIPMSFALVTTVHESGETGIGPHALLYPFGITAPHSMLLISRGNSGTAANIRRTGLCALNYIEFDHDSLKGIATMGYPGQSLEEKAKANPYSLVEPPPNGPATGPRPQIIAEACQIFECTWDRNIDIDGQLGHTEETAAAHFVLNIDRILMKERYTGGIDDGSSIPHMPVFYGYRTDSGFWFSEHAEPFSIPIPKVEGQELQAVVYLANRMDEKVRFTEAACSKLTAIPRPFLKQALQGIVAAAHEMEIDTIDEAALDKIAADRMP